MRVARIFWPVCALLGLALLVGALMLLHGRQNADGSSEPVNDVSLPAIDLEGVDPAIVAALDGDRRMVQQQPMSASSWGALAMTLQAHEFEQQAADCYSRAAALDPNDPRWPYLHARTIRMTDPQSAVQQLQRAVALTGNNPAAVRLTLCELLMELNRLDEAEQQLATFLAEQSEDPRARIAQARLMFRRGNNAECIQQLEGLITYLDKQGRLKDRRLSLQLLMAEALRRQGQVERSEELRHNAMHQTDPSWPDPYYNQVRDRKTGLKVNLVEADLMFGRREYEKSIELLQQTVQKYPDSIWGKILLARALIRTGAPDSKHPDRAARLQHAQELLEDVLRVDQNSVEAMFRLGVAKGYQHETAEAAALYERAISIKPDFAEAYYNLALCRAQLQDIDGAIQAAEAAVAAEPTLVDGYRVAGSLLLQLGRYAQAERQLDRAVRLQPDDNRLRQLLGEARRQMQP
jgi:tetratricopeptide (TPR) repeat protein